MFRAGTRVALAASVVVAAAAVAVGVTVGASGPANGRGSLAAAMTSLPASTTVAGFTDWAYVAERGSLAAARDRDLVTRSVLVDVAPGLARSLGVRLSDLRWEVFGQGGFGQGAVVRLDRAMPTASRLRDAGYQRDAKTGLWSATGRVAAEGLIYSVVAVLPKDGVLVLGASGRAVTAVAEVVRGRASSFVSSRQVAEAVTALANVHTALVQTRGIGCQTTDPGRDPEAARQAAAAQQRFGRLVPFSVLARGLRDAASDTQRFRVAMTFPTAAVAVEQARIREALSSGPFIGRSGDMAEVLRLRSAGSDGRTVLLAYDHPADSEYLMTGQGPLLPASC